jgi:hypothetical protein
MCNTPTPVRCPACDSRILVELFPAFFRSSAVGQTGEPILEEGVASCFYHDQKKATVHCDACGRFLCALCDLQLDQRHYCPSCLHTARAKGRMPELDNQRTLYDSAALVTALWPILFWPLIILTAPAAIYLAIRSFSRPSSIIPRTRWRAVLAIVLAALELTGTATLFYMFFSQRA